MKTWHFFDKVYRAYVVLLLGEPADFYQFMEDAGYKDMEGLKQLGTTAMCIQLNDETNDRGSNCTVLWLRKFETACLVHELAHLVMFIFDDHGIPIRRENTEAFSYYQEFWYNEIVRTRRRLPGGRSTAESRKNH